MLVRCGNVYPSRDIVESYPGVPHSDHSDASLLLRLMASGKERHIEELDGVFVMAHWDEPSARLTIINDRYGPLICLTPSETDSESADLVRQHNAGVVIDIDDFVKIRSALFDLIKRRNEGQPLEGANDRAAHCYDRRNMTANLAGIFDSTETLQ